jgi:hypothetical protein
MKDKIDRMTISPIYIILPSLREFALEFGLSFSRFFECPVNSFHSPFFKITTRPHHIINVMLFIIDIP